MISSYKKIIKHVVVLFLLSSLFTHSLLAVEIESIYDAVNIAGKQRMFTQRMLKDYAMIGMKNSFGNASKDLNNTISKFEDHLHALHNYTKNSKIKKSTKKAEEIWLPIKKILQSPPNKNEVIKLQSDLEELLLVSNDITDLFAKETGKEAGEIVDISGRQRMLSQRMASLYMLKVWGTDDKMFKDKMKESMHLFKSSLEELKKSKLNTNNIDKMLDKVEKSFMFFEVMNKSRSVFIPSLIYKKSNDILKNMNEITQCYVKESK